MVHLDSWPFEGWFKHYSCLLGCRPGSWWGSIVTYYLICLICLVPAVRRQRDLPRSSSWDFTGPLWRRTSMSMKVTDGTFVDYWLMCMCICMYWSVCVFMLNGTCAWGVIEVYMQYNKPFLNLPDFSCSFQIPGWKISPETQATDCWGAWDSLHKQ